MGMLSCPDLDLLIASGVAWLLESERILLLEGIEGRGVSEKSKELVVKGQMEEAIDWEDQLDQPDL